MASTFPPPPPPVPMPPMQGSFQGGPHGPPPGAIPVHDYHASPFPDDRQDTWSDDFDQRDVKPKKGKKGKEDKTPVEIKYEGYMLEKVEPRRGEKYSWARIGKRALPFADDKLIAIVKEHKKRTRTESLDDFGRLSSKQQGVIDRLIDDRKQAEKNKNADWVLADVQRFGKWHWTSMEVKKIQVILKRVDKNGGIKAGEHSTRGVAAKSYQNTEIIDLAEPIYKTKDKDWKKAKRSKSVENLDLLDDDPLGLGIEPQPNRRHHVDQHHQEQFMQPMMPPPLPHGAIPINPHGHDQFLPGPPPMPPQHAHPSARHSFQGNPFQPNAEFAAPGQFDSPPTQGQDFPHPHNRQRNEDRSRSQPRRKSSTRRPSMSARRASQYEDNDLNRKMRNWHFDHGSSEDSYEDDSMFSPPPSDLHDFTPPSSPRSQFSDRIPAGSLERRKSYGRDLRYHPRYRSHKYRDVEIEPEYTYRSNTNRYSGESRRHSSRPRLRQTVTYDDRDRDDYPSGRAAEQRYLPAPPRPQPLRRQTDFNDRYDNDDYDDTRRRDSRRQSMVSYDPVREAYEQGRRDSAMNGRRQSQVGGGRYWE